MPHCLSVLYPSNDRENIPAPWVPGNLGPRAMLDRSPSPKEYHSSGRDLGRIYSDVEALGQGRCRSGLREQDVTPNCSVMCLPVTMSQTLLIICLSSCLVTEPPPAPQSYAPPPRESYYNAEMEMNRQEIRPMAEYTDIDRDTVRTNQQKKKYIYIYGSHQN